MRGRDRSHRAGCSARHPQEGRRGDAKARSLKAQITPLTIIIGATGTSPVHRCRQPCHQIPDRRKPARSRSRPLPPDLAWLRLVRSPTVAMPAPDADLIPERRIFECDRPIGSRIHRAQAFQVWQRVRLGVRKFIADHNGLEAIHDPQSGEQHFGIQTRGVRSLRPWEYWRHRRSQGVPSTPARAVFSQQRDFGRRLPFLP